MLERYNIVLFTSALNNRNYLHSCRIERIINFYFGANHKYISSIFIKITYLLFLEGGERGIKFGENYIRLVVLHIASFNNLTGSTVIRSADTPTNDAH